MGNVAQLVNSLPFYIPPNLTKNSIVGTLVTMTPEYKCFVNAYSCAVFYSFFISKKKNKRKVFDISIIASQKKN